MITSVEAFQLSGAGTYIFDQGFLGSYQSLADVGLGDTANVTVKARALIAPDQDITDSPGDAIASLELSAPGGLDASGVSGWSGRSPDRRATCLTASEGLSAVSGRGGDDVITGSSGADAIYGDGGDDTIAGGHGDDQILGGSGDDIIRGGDGADTISGGHGDDEIEGGAGADVIRGGSGYNTVVYYANQDDFLVIGQPDASGLRRSPRPRTAERPVSVSTSCTTSRRSSSTSTTARPVATTTGTSRSTTTRTTSRPTRWASAMASWSAA